MNHYERKKLEIADKKISFNYCYPFRGWGGEEKPGIVKGGLAGF